MTTAQDLIDDIRSRAMLPDQAVTDEALLRFINGEMISYLVPLLIRVNEEFLVDGKFFPVDSSPFFGEIDIPKEAVGGKIRSVMYQSSPGNLRILPQYDLSDLGRVDGTGEPSGYALNGDKITLFPKSIVGGGGVLILFHRRPDALTEVNDYLPDEIPMEAYPLLSQRVVAKVLSAMGDPRADGARREADEVREDFVNLIQPRAQGWGKVIVNRHAPGTRWRYR